MKRILLLIGFSLSIVNVRAGHERAADLVSVMEESVTTAARGELGAAFRQLNSEAHTPKSLKEVNAQAENFKTAYQKVAQLGELDTVERVSLVYTGESFFRLRLAEKHAEGVILWTLLGYRFKGMWYCKGINFNGSDDLLSLMRQELDPADAQPASKQ